MIDTKLKHIINKYSLSFDEKKFQNVKKIIQYLGELDEEILENIILENYTIGESYFFRDENLWNILKRKIQTKNNWDILSLGCSRGEEVYTMSFILNDSGINYSIKGVDLSYERIQQAIKGEYKFWSVRFLKKDLIEKYFEKKDNFFYVKNNYKRDISFMQRNIILEAKDNSKTYDIIFIRRVLIYFEEYQISKILNDLKLLLKKDGYLILGKGEFYPELLELFEPEFYDDIVLWKNSKNKILKKNTKTSLFKNKINLKYLEKKNLQPSKNNIEKNILKDKILKTYTHVTLEEELEIIEEMLNKENFIMAYERISHAIEKYPLNYLLWKYKGFVELRLGKNFKDSISKAIYLNPDDPELWHLKNS
ncbi:MULTISPECIES: CheR family methyltransferase [unclassified Marinitoga]|uniref:CheR family methyltransferase n=1 Tax=unclassified Marinitoga TaxID=2640159 RepID=UPI00158690E5|nr:MULTISPECIES: CheR family methyltransferase [unclassified Marinitoga]